MQGVSDDDMTEFGEDGDCPLDDITDAAADEIVKEIVEKLTDDGDPDLDSIDIGIGAGAEIEKSIAISSNLRRTITGEETPYREDTDLEVHEIMCSVNIHHSDDRNSAYKLHPLVAAYDDKDAVWREVDAGVLCFHCCHTFDGGCTVRIPHSVSEAGIYTVHPAAFCSLSCAKAHLVEHAVDNSIRLRLLHRVARDVYNWQGEVLPTAPSRICLAAFGGSMSIDEFRSSGVTARAREPPFVPLRVMTEHTPLLQAEEIMNPPTPVDDGLPQNAVWDVQNLRRPVRPVVLPREASSERSLLEHFADSQVSGVGWDAEKHTQNTLVTSQTPSLREVTMARDGVSQQETTTIDPSRLAPAPDTKKRRSRRRKYGGDTSGPQAAFDLSAFIEED